MPTPLSTVLREAIEPAYRLLPARMNSPEASVQLLANGGQESAYTYTDQVERDGGDRLGPALGWWQFERGGGVLGVMNHDATGKHAAHLAEARGVMFSPGAIWRALKTDQVLAAGMARLLLWSDTHPLPKLGEVDDAFDLYVRTWRPGAYWGGDDAAKRKLRAKFGRWYTASIEAVRGAA